MTHIKTISIKPPVRAQLATLIQLVSLLQGILGLLEGTQRYKEEKQ